MPPVASRQSSIIVPGRLAVNPIEKRRTVVAMNSRMKDSTSRFKLASMIPLTGVAAFSVPALFCGVTPPETVRQAGKQVDRRFVGQPKTGGLGMVASNCPRGPGYRRSAQSAAGRDRKQDICDVYT